MKIEKDADPEEPLKFLTGSRTDPLDHLPAFAEDDRLLRFTIDDDGAIQPQNWWRRGCGAFDRLLEPIDDDGAGERDLGMRELQQLFADDFSGQNSFRLVRQIVEGIEELPFRQSFVQ